MSSIICNECGQMIIDEMKTSAGTGGYITACEHFPPKKLEAISGRSFNGEWWYNPCSWGCGEGWHSLIWKLIADLKKIAKEDGIELEPSQIKEKFGGLRFYLQSGTDKMFDRIDEAEDESFKTCEGCGKKGQTRDNNGWYNTFCVKCHKEWVKDTGYNGKAKVIK